MFYRFVYKNHQAEAWWFLINLEVNLLIGILEELTLQELCPLVQPICLLSCNQWEFHHTLLPGVHPCVHQTL